MLRLDDPSRLTARSWLLPFLQPATLPGDQKGDDDHDQRHDGRQQYQRYALDRVHVHCADTCVVKATNRHERRGAAAPRTGTGSSRAAGDDTLVGEDGDDRLDGGGGTDSLNGGEDNDVGTRGETYKSCEVIL